jgi:DnaK suppressor protein
MTINLQEMKKRLLAKQVELQGVIAEQTEAYPTPVSTEEISEGSQEFEETAVDFLEMQQEQSVLVNEQALLSEVQAALKRIEDGTYGRCVVCGEPIPEKRLEAIPWASRCVKDEALLEQRNLSREELYDSETT